MAVAPEQQRAIARITAAQVALDEVQVDPRLVMAAKAIQLMAGQDDKGNPKISADMALAAAMYQAGTGQLLGRDFYVNEKIGRMEGYRGVSRDAIDRGVGEVQIKYRSLTAQECDDHEIAAGDTAVVCEVYQLRAWNLAQRMGQPYEPIFGVGVVRKVEKYDKKSVQRWDDSAKRYVPLPESGWRFLTLEGGMTWRKKAQNRAYKEALRHVPGGLASAAEVLEAATINGMTNHPPEAARLSMDQAIEWAKQHQPDNGPDWGSIEEGDFVEVKPVTAQDAANDAAFEALPSASAERAGGNGKAAPHSDRPFKDQGSAVRWACRFDYYRKDGKPDVPHAVGSLKKLCAELGCSDREVDCWADAWMDYVATKAAATMEPTHAELDAAAAAQS